MSDIAAPEIAIWQRIESTARRVFSLYGYTEVRTPVLEKQSVFERSLGDTTEVVQKEMYAFEDRGGRRVALRPEGTAGVMRHVASLGQEGEEARLFYLGPMFRGERPAAGRKRQFHQIGAEFIGAPNAAMDVETIALQAHLLREWGLKNFKLHVNTRGLPEDRKKVHESLRALLDPRRGELGEEDQRRIDVNILRVLDSKDEKTRAVVATLPPLTEFMGEGSRSYLRDVMAMLERLELDAQVNPTLIRGLDYYVHTVWEITHPALGAQDALAGGGRYRIAMGSREIEGVGFAMGVERLVMAVQQELGAEAVKAARAPAWLVALGEAAFAENFKLAQALRMRGIGCGLDLTGRSMKAQMRAASRAGAAVVVIRGESEMQKGTFVVKDMATGSQVEVELPELLERLSVSRA